MIIALRAVLAVVLLVGAYLLVTVLLLFYLALIALCVWTISEGTFNVMFVWLLIGGGFVIIALVRALARASGPSGDFPNGIVLHRDRAPALWELVDELAMRAGTKAPAELWLTGEANAAVSEESRALGLLAGPRRMEIGIPLLVGLSTDELRAALCHELGHYAKGHTRLGPLTYRGSVALADARRNIARAALGNTFARMYGGLPLYLLTGYAWLYNGISLAVRRRQELDADAIAARIAGRPATAAALRSAHSLSLAWEDFRSRILAPMHQLRLMPDNPFGAFHAMINDPDYRDVLAAIESQPPPQRVRGDSHPSLDQRLAKIDRLPEGAEPRNHTPALELLPDPEQHFRRVWRQTTRWRSEPMPWRDWLAAFTEHHVATRLDQLRKALHRLGRKPATLRPGEVLDLLEAGQGDRLANALATELSMTPTGPAPARAQLDEAVVMLVGQALVQAGSASWTVPWIGNPRLITRDLQPEELHDLVRAAVDKPAEVPRLRLTLASSTVDVERPVAAPRTAAAPAETAFDDDTELLAEQRSSLTLILAVIIPVVGIAAIISLSSNDDRPQYTPPRYPPAITTPGFYSGPPIPTLLPPLRPPALPTFVPPVPLSPAN